MSQQDAVENDEKHDDLWEWAYGIYNFTTNKGPASEHQMYKEYIESIYGSTPEGCVK